jgi:branched-chain amino acid transport system substrate-binding protein
VKIGLVAPFEGRYRYVGYDVIYAVRLALREANAAGGVGGYHVELVAYDDGADPTMAVEQSRKLDADPAVVASIGHFRQETTAAASGAYAEAGIPLVAPALAGGQAEVYHLGPAVGALADELLRYLVESGHSQAALVTQGGPLGTALRRDARAHRLRVWPVVSPHDTGWLKEVGASGVAAVFCDADPVTAGEAIAALRDTGWKGGFLGGPELAAPDFVAVADQAAEGTLFATPWLFPAHVVGDVDFVAAYRAASNGVPPGPLAPAAYEATWVLLEALQRDVAAHGTLTRGGVAAALPDTARRGMLGLITFDADRSWGSAPLYWYRVGARGAVERVP